MTLYDYPAPMIFLADAADLAKWQVFYEIVGSASGALVGIQFVVIALIASRQSRADLQAINAFGTPTVVHFGTALMIAAAMSAPWPSARAAGLALLAAGVLGVAYVALIFHRTRRQTSYRPVLEDWVWFVAMPGVLYATLGAGAAWLAIDGRHGPFAIATAALGLMFVGVRNAWDSVTHIVARADDALPGLSTDGGGPRSSSLGEDE